MVFKNTLQVFFLQFLWLYTWLPFPYMESGFIDWNVSCIPFPVSTQREVVLFFSWTTPVPHPWTGVSHLISLRVQLLSRSRNKSNEWLQLHCSRAPGCALDSSTYLALILVGVKFLGEFLLAGELRGEKEALLKSTHFLHTLQSSRQPSAITIKEFPLCTILSHPDFHMSKV